MKKLTLATFLFLGLIGFSQENTEEKFVNPSKLAVKLAFSNIKYEDSEGKNENVFSPTIGISANFGKKVSFQPELLLSFNKLDMSNEYYESYSNNTFRDTYKYDGNVLKISLPLLIKVNIVESFSLYSGVTPSVIILNKDKSEIIRGFESELTPYKMEKGSSFNGSVTLGVDYKINSKFFVDVRYNFTPSFLNEYDFSVIYDSNINLYEKSSLQIGLGYYLF